MRSAPALAAAWRATSSATSPTATTYATLASGPSKGVKVHRRLIRWTFTPLLGPEASVAYVVAVGDVADDVARQAAASAGAERMKQVQALVATLTAADTREQVAQT